MAPRSRRAVLRSNSRTLKLYSLLKRQKGPASRPNMASTAKERSHRSRVLRPPLTGGPTGKGHQCKRALSLVGTVTDRRLKTRRAGLPSRLPTARDQEAMSGSRAISTRSPASCGAQASYRGGFWEHAMGVVFRWAFPDFSIPQKRFVIISEPGQPAWSQLMRNIETRSAPRAMNIGTVRI